MDIRAVQPMVKPKMRVVRRIGGASRSGKGCSRLLRRFFLSLT